MEQPLNNDTISKAQWEFAKTILEQLQFSDQISTRAPPIPLATQNIQGLEGWAFRIAWSGFMSTNTAQKESHMQAPKLQVSELLNTHSSPTQVKEKKICSHLCLQDPKKILLQRSLLVVVSLAESQCMALLKSRII